MASKAFSLVTMVVLGAVIALDQPTAKVVPKPSSVGSQPRAIPLNSRPINGFRKDGRDELRFGKLKWRGGLVLSSRDKVFGGYSGIEISADGRSILAVSDAGTWMSAEISYDKQGRPVSAGSARIGALLARGNKDLRRRWDRDAESIRLIRGSTQAGEALISFELNQRVGFFPIVGGILQGPSRYLRPGRGMKANKGLEAVALFGNRRVPSVIAFAERALDDNGHHRGWIWRGGRGKAIPVALTNDGGFDITDAVGLRDGRLLVLERRFRWSEGVKMRIREIPAKRLKPHGLLLGRTLLRADLRYEIDNMEGIAVHTDAAGRTILTLISDDNFNSFLQRTLLLQFELPDGA